MEQRALALDEQHLAAALDTLDDESLGGAGDEVGDDRVDGDPPACDRDPRLAGRDELAADAAAAAPRGRARATTVIFPIAQSEPTVRIVVAPCVRFSPVGTLRPAGGLRRSRSSTPCSRGERDSSGSSETNSCRPLSTSSPAAMQSFEQVAPRRREAPALRRDADERGRRRRAAARRRRVATTGKPSTVSRRSRRVEDRDDVVGPVAHHAASGLAEVRIARAPFGEDRGAYAGATPSPGASEGSWTPSANSTPGHGSSASSRLPSRSTWSMSLAMCAPAAMPEPGLDHAAEHHAEPERARGGDHAHRFADPARLRQLDVDPVRALGAGRDVGERVAVLVDVDRDRASDASARARPDRRPAAAARSTGGRSAAGTRAPRRASRPR